jgi:signal transduction histidine kinase
VYLQTRTYEHGGFHAARGHEATAPCRHSVHFYEDDSAFLDNLSEFVGAALGTGGACIVIATRLHRQGLNQRLQAFGIDPSVAESRDRYILMDAEETLRQFMTDGWPDDQLFRAAIEPELLRAKSAQGKRTGSIVAFGEMVALLWSEGKYGAAIHLERLWNDLALSHAFSLRCAYPMKCFADESQYELFSRVCEEHGSVIPTESYTAIESEDERLRMVSCLQQRAWTAQAVAEARDRESAQRERVEERLRRSEEFSKSVVESSVDCVKVLDLEGRLEYMSIPGQIALEIEDVSQFLGRRWVDFWSAEDRPRAEAAVRAARAGQTGSFQGDCPTEKGTVKSWDVRITPGRSRDGEIERLIAVSRDITELKIVQKAAIQAEKLAAAGRLAATIAHEINNPLEAVTNFVYLAMTAPDVPEEVRQHLEIADRELARVAQIAKQTLGFYKDNSKHRWVDVAGMFQDVMVIYDRKLRNKEIDAVVSIDPELKIFAKEGELKQALSNLMANAIDASREGGEIRLRAQKTKNWTNGLEEGVRITVADNGSGMSPEVQKRIFVPFFTTKADVGTGIGLWVTKCLIEQQGGTMRFRSRQGERSGTVMSFYLPQISHECMGTVGVAD